MVAVAHYEHVQHFASLYSADWVERSDGAKAIADYTGLPSTSGETKVLVPLMPSEV